MKKAKKAAAPAATKEAVAPLPPKPTVELSAEHRAYWRHSCLRLRYIHDEVSAGNFPKRKGIAKKFEVDERTITRDITYIRDQMVLPIKYDRKRRGYYYTHPVKELPRPKLSTGEVLTMFIARCSLERYKGTSFAEDIAECFKRYATEFSTDIDGTWDQLASGVSFRPCLFLSPDMLENTRIVHQAIRASEELKLEYWGLNDDEHLPRRIQPYHLTCDGKGWYLFAYDHDRGEIREFHIVRMRNLECTGVPFEKPADFDPEAKLKHSIGVYGGDQPERVRLRLFRIPARILSESPLHPTQQITFHKKGEAELTMDVAINPEVIGEIMKWGEQVEVLEPEHLFNTVMDKAEAMVAMRRKRRTAAMAERTAG